MQTVEQLLGGVAGAGEPAAGAPRDDGRLRAPARLLRRASGCCARVSPADEFFVIRRGAVAVETEVPGRGAVTLETLGPGEILGWSWLVPPYRSAFGARALDAVHVIALDGACLRGKCERDPALGFDLLKVVATVFVRRLEETRMRLLDLYAGVPRCGLTRPPPTGSPTAVRRPRDAWTLRLEAVDGDAAPRFAPGQFSMLYVLGSGEVPISISAIPEDGRRARAHRARGRRGHADAVRRAGGRRRGRPRPVRARLAAGARPRAATWWSSRAGSGSRRCARSSTS